MSNDCRQGPMKSSHRPQLTITFSKRASPSERRRGASVRCDFVVTAEAPNASLLQRGEEPMSSRFVVSLSLVLLALTSPFAAAQPADNCARTIKANVDALDQPFFLNRLGAMMPEGMVFALDRDVERVTTCPAGQWCPRARLKAYKRPRPIVLRANVGDCLQIYFTNLLSDTVAPFHGIQGVQPATRVAGIHVAGMQLVRTINDDSS